MLAKSATLLDFQLSQGSVATYIAGEVEIFVIILNFTHNTTLENMQTTYISNKSKCV